MIMDSFLIRGGTRLKGKIEISGSKNSALPIMAACLMAEGKTTLKGVPRLSDIDSMSKLIGELGCHVYRHEPRRATCSRRAMPRSTARSISKFATRSMCEARYDIVKTMRASICVLGPLLAKRGKAVVSIPGGCAIGDRPVDLHVRGLQKLGAEFRTENGNIVGEVRGRLKGCRMYLGGAQGPTVLGTINVVCAAALAEGETVLVGAACEPEVFDCAEMLNKMGAKIKGHGTPEIRIEGVDRLTGCEHRVIPDRIECGTFMIAAAITNGELELKHCNLDHLIAVVDRLEEVGVKIERQNGTIFVSSSRRLNPVEMTTQPYPGFPTDLQAQLMALLVPGGRDQRGHRADLPRPLPARRRAESHGRPHPQGRPDGHYPGRQGTAGRQRDGQRPARLGGAGAGGAGGAGHDAHRSRLPHRSRVREDRAEACGGGGGHRAG